jgi:hypothetical protein
VVRNKKGLDKSAPIVMILYFIVIFLKVDDYACSCGTQLMERRRCIQGRVVHESKLPTGFDHRRTRESPPRPIRSLMEAGGTCFQVHIFFLCGCRRRSASSVWVSKFCCRAACCKGGEVSIPIVQSRNSSIQLWSPLYERHLGVEPGPLALEGSITSRQTYSRCM